MIARRGVIAGTLALPFAARAAVADDAQFDAVVDPATGTLGDALKRATGRPYRILLRPGMFVEKLTITTPNVTIIGSGPETILVYGTASGTPKPGGGTYGTGGSYTLGIEASGVTIENLTIRNSYDYIGAKRDKAGNGAQAVALAVGRAADRTLVRRCRLEGYQDTLYVHTRALFEDCRIVGGVDFIFGGAAAWFERCEIVTRFVPGATEFGYLTAPSTPLSQPYGLVFSRCRITRERGVPNGSTWLGRPWRAGGNMALTGQSVFLDCWMDAHIKRAGWTSMGYTNPAGERTQLTPQEARLFEYASRGPGAGPAAETRRRLDAERARDFTRDKVLGGWDGRAGQP